MTADKTIVLITGMHFASSRPARLTETILFGKLTQHKGANQGVGFETAKILLCHSPSYHILLGSRSTANGQAAADALRAVPGVVGTVEPITLDVTLDQSVDDAAALVLATHGRLDTLVNNAGILRWGGSRDDARAIFETNVVGYISVTEAFLPLLKLSKIPRLVFVSSSTASLTHAADPGSKYYSPGALAYRSGGAARNMIMVLYWAKLKEEGFKVFGADPGLTATQFAKDPDLLRKRGAVEPEVGGERIACVVRGDRDADIGHVCGEYGVSPW